MKAVNVSVIEPIVALDFAIHAPVAPFTTCPRVALCQLAYDGQGTNKLRGKIDFLVRSENLYKLA